MAKKQLKADNPSSVQTLKGMHDLLPTDAPLWDFFVDKVKVFAQSYDYSRIEPPILEDVKIFSRSIGEGTDIVDKEMYTFIDKGGDHIALRPEYTASIARSYIQHGMFSLPQPVKLYYVGPAFRHDNPQYGRFRQFYHFGYEVLGDRHPVVDAQLIILVYKLYSELGLPVTVSINSIGDQACRPQYIANLVEYVKAKKSQLCEVCKGRIEKNPLRILDCKEPGCQRVVEEAPQIVDWLCVECREHFVKVLEFLDELEVPYVLNPRLVRGLDYYSRTTFEFFSAEEGDQQLALGGGGRYDGLVEELGGRPTPAVGYAGGIERVLQKIKERGVISPVVAKPVVYLAQLGNEARKYCLGIFDDLRKGGIIVAENFSKDGLAAQLEAAGKLHVRFTLILGQKEILDKTIIIRDMESGVQEIVDLAKIVGEVKKRIQKSNQQVYSANDISVHLQEETMEENSAQTKLF